MTRAIYNACIMFATDANSPFTQLRSNFVYIDGTDVATDRKFVSSVLGAELLYMNWQQGEPTNNNNEGCINIYRDSGKWNDIPCDYQLPSICELQSSFKLIKLNLHLVE